MKLLFQVSCYATLAAMGFVAAVLVVARSDPGGAIDQASIDERAAQPVVSKGFSEEIVGLAETAVENKAGPVSSNQGSVADTLFGANIGGSFDLIDHFGDAKQLEDYRGHYVMIFFGYANCLAICSAALPLMADTIDHLQKIQKADLIPLMITVDPENDTPAHMRSKLGAYHPAIIGMTGSEAQLADVRKKFQVKTEYVGTDIENNPIFNHGSFIYLLGRDGKLKTLVPPILEPKQMAKIFSGYMME